MQLQSKTVWWLLNELNIELPCHCSNSISGYISKELRTRLNKNLYKNFHRSIIHNNQKTEKKTQMSITNEWIDRV